MRPEQLRSALQNLNGERDVVFYFEGADECLVPRAILIPDEADHLLKLTDGRHEYMIDAERVAWLRVG